MDGTHSGTRPYRLGAFVDGTGWVEHVYGRVWEQQSHRIVAAPDTGQVDLLIKLSATLEGPFHVEYDLLVPRDEDLDEGRFELVDPLDHDSLNHFLNRFRDLFEGDGRHHIRIASSDPSAYLVYDQHNVLFLHGSSERYVTILKEQDLTEGKVIFPSPHSHHYHDHLDPMLDELLKSYKWKSFPLDSSARI